jgi:hypothetical protein
MSDLDEPAGEHMQEKPPDEFDGLPGGPSAPVAPVSVFFSLSWS